jgi:non-specific serine/threonine protein kinase
MSVHAEAALQDEVACYHCYRFANAEFDEMRFVLRVDGAEVRVEPRPLALLVALLRRPDEVIDRAELKFTVWEGRPTVDHVLASAVNRLRAALGPQAGARIVNRPRVGYRLDGPVQCTVVGRFDVRLPDLAAGAPAPGRPDVQLIRPLDGAQRGHVWLAGQPPGPLSDADELVLKYAGSPQGLAGLKREVTIFRTLEHDLGKRPDFVQILGWHFEGPPYFVEYEYGGIDLPTWAAQADEFPKLSCEARLVLFVQIATAVQRAHDVGVLHKDIKPSNVLVSPHDSGSGWQIKLADFGSGKLLNPERSKALGITMAGLTQGLPDAVPEAISGTARYLAPELLAGQPPSVQTDLYALAILLYQLLAGDFEKPMSTGWQRDVPDELLREDLTAATEGRPEDRLPSVAALLDRLATLERRRADQVLLAQERRRADDAAAQLQQSLARRPWVVAAFASLSIGLAASLWFYSRTAAALHRADEESARAQSINDFLNKDVLLSADVTRVGTNKTGSMLDVLRRASANVGERFKDQPRTQASIRKQLGDVYLRMFYLTEAEGQFTQALALLEPIAPEGDTEVLALRFDLARVRTGRFHPEEALSRLETAERATGAQRLKGNDALAVLAARTRLEVLMDADRDKEALPVAQRLVALSDSSPGADAALRFDARQRLGELYARLGDDARAKSLLAQIMAPPYDENSVGDVLFARAKLQLARQRINEGQLDQAEALLTDVRDTLTRSLGSNELHVGLANSELADLLQSRGNFAQALVAARATSAAFKASLGESHTFVLITDANVAAIQLSLGDAADALSTLDRLRPRIAANHRLITTLAGVDFSRAQAMNDLGQFAQALEVLNTINPELLSDSSWGPRDWPLKLQAEKGRAVRGLGQKREGLAMLREAVAGMRKAGTQAWQLAAYEKAEK